MKDEDIERLLDNAACASQCRGLLRDDDGHEPSLREAVRLNVVNPLLEIIRCYQGFIDERAKGTP